MSDHRSLHLPAIQERLKLSRVSDDLDRLAEEAARDHGSAVAFQEHVLEGDVSARTEGDVTRTTRLARCPFVKTLEPCDFSFQPALNEAQIRELAAARFVANGENLVLLGPPGVGHTHLAISLGGVAILQGMSVVFCTVADLVDLREQDAKEDRLKQRLAALCKPTRLILDEMGSIPLDQRFAQFLCRLISCRSQKGSSILTSNTSSGEWGTVVSDPVLATAMLDRLLHSCTTIPLRGESSRLREKRLSGVFQDLTASSNGSSASRSASRCTRGGKRGDASRTGFENLSSWGFVSRHFWGILLAIDNRPL
jgi:DNA replication protein DnaC